MARPALLAALVALAGCGAPAPPRLGPADGCARRYAAPRESARVASAALAEVSGIVASRTHEGVLWAHNDSGDEARLYALDARTGEIRGVWALEGAVAIDWEDIALERVEGARDRLWIADVGDNAARHGHGLARETVSLLRIEEPDLPPPGAPGPLSVARYDEIVLRYADHPRDAEAIAIDPRSGDVYLFAKEAFGASTVYVVRAPVEPGVVRALEPVASVEMGSMVTGADISPAGDELLVRSYRSIAAWSRAPGEGWAEALSRPGRALPHAGEPQGEAIAFASDGRGYFTVSEGARSPIWFFARRCE